MGIPGVDLHVPTSIALSEQKLMRDLRAMSDEDFFERAATRMGREHAAEVLGWSATKDVQVEMPAGDVISRIPQQTDAFVPAEV